MKRLIASGLVLATILAVVVGVLGIGTAGAALPSSKTAVAVGQIIDLEAAALSPDEATVPATNSTGWRNIMKTAIQVNSQGDLAADLAMQCALVTDTTVSSKNLTQDVSEAQAGIRFRVALYPWTSDGKLGEKPLRYFQPQTEVVPYPTKFDTIDDQGSRAGVTYCDRYQKLAAKFAGFNCTTDPLTGVYSCLDPEELQLVISTLDAHAFNFFTTDLPSGRYWIVVEGKADAAALDQAGAKAMAGLGSLMVEKIRLVKGAELTTGIPID